jgi:cyclopropane fatty-acyl-phospholipid synthase-like methyltransferase
MAWIAKHATTDEVSVLDLGGRDVNGSPRHLWPNATRYTVLDIRAGDRPEDVDIIADASTWNPAGMTWDVVVCAETFEHTGSWPGICRTAFTALVPGGLFIATMAGPGRPAHSAIDGLFHLYPGEHYANVPPEELHRVLEEFRFTDIVVDQQFAPCDVRCTARRPNA